MILKMTVSVIIPTDHASPQVKLRTVTDEPMFQICESQMKCPIKKVIYLLCFQHPSINYFPPAVCTVLFVLCHQGAGWFQRQVMTENKLFGVGGRRKLELSAHAEI